MTMRILALVPGLVGLLLAMPAQADPRDLPHVHVGGAISHRPHTFTLQVWYRDIVYNDEATDHYATSLDVYTADPVEAGSPVMVFVHGGGFRVGDKASSKDLDPKPEYFTSKLGYVFVSTNYRLLPDGRYPRNAQDVADALAWVADNIAQFGGDPDRIFLMGHSAGAALVAQVATDEQFLQNAGKDLGLLKGVIANEGSYGLADTDEQAQRNLSLYGEQWRDKVALANVAADKGIPPFLLFHVTGGDSLLPDSGREAVALGKKLANAGVRADVVALDHVEHFGANERIGEPGDATTVAVETFLDSITGRKVPATWTPAGPLGGRR